MPLWLRLQYCRQKPLKRLNPMSISSKRISKIEEKFTINSREHKDNFECNCTKDNIFIEFAKSAILMSADRNGMQRNVYFV